MVKSTFNISYSSKYEGYDSFAPIWVLFLSVFPVEQLFIVCMPSISSYQKDQRLREGKCPCCQREGGERKSKPSENFEKVVRASDEREATSVREYPLVGRAVSSQTHVSQIQVADEVTKSAKCTK